MFYNNQSIKLQTDLWNYQNFVIRNFQIRNIPMFRFVRNR